MTRTWYQGDSSGGYGGGQIMLSNSTPKSLLIRIESRAASKGRN